MHLAQPIYLNGLFLVAGIVVFFAWQRVSRKKQISKFSDSRLSGRLIRHFDPKTENIRILLIVLGFTFLCLTLCRPQWGNRWEQMKQRGLDILIALDVSKSMLSEDVKPSRFERSKLAIKDFVRRLNGDRVGLIAFAGDAYLACPLTSDYAGFNLTLDDLTVGSIGQGGTDIASAIREAGRAYEGAAGPNKILIVITDGENNEGDPVSEAKKVKNDNNIHIYTVGIGTPEGELIPIKEDGGQTGFLKDKEGLVVKSRLDEETLQKIADASDGLYVRSSAMEFGLSALYKNRFSNFEKKTYDNKTISLREERFGIFLFIAFILLAIESMLSENLYEEKRR